MLIHCASHCIGGTSPATWRIAGVYVLLLNLYRSHSSLYSSFSRYIIFIVYLDIIISRYIVDFLYIYKNYNDLQFEIEEVALKLLKLGIHHLNKIIRPVSMVRFIALFPKQICWQSINETNNETTSTMHKFHLDVS